jgi:hypothetical protein
MTWSRSFAVLALLAATPAVAQPYPAEPYYGGIVSPRHVMRTVADMGLQPVSEPHLRGNVWIVRGVGREGTMVRVVLDSHTGRVVEMHTVNLPGPYGPGVQPGPYERPYEPDPRYVMRDQPYGPPGYPAPAPRSGEVYQPGPAGAVPDDDDFDDGQPGPQPRGYVPPRSSYPATDKPRVSSKPEQKRVASKPPSVPVPKARPGDIKADVKVGTAKKDEGKKDADKKDVAKQDEPKKEQAAAPLTSPKDPDTTASLGAAHKKALQAKKQELPPVQPLE